MEVGTWGDIDGLQDALRLDTIDDLEVGSVVASDCPTELTLLVEFGTDAAGDLCEVRKTIHASIEVSPDRLDLSDAEEKRVHKAENVEGHLLRGERAYAMSLELVCDRVGGAHQAGPAGPS